MKRGKSVAVETECYGLFAKWSNQCRELPRFLKFTKTIPARVESEFGYLLYIRGGKGTALDYRIIHPPFLNSSGDITPDFVGSIPIRSNAFQAYVGDTLWEPLDDKCGPWRIISQIKGRVVADTTFTVVSEPTLYDDLITRHAREHL
ncbi:DUF3859 domain-containing protein [Chitinivibrio alkaliphilus]|uniref:DUF3859 domain-containing protein n=1 Tax=Chitinivibrio alkaliphilus ACht1 TaxID=1313304 RepID=U7D3P3_9BACT|nr:DUF3859 domain-containing protein [Chitinivibrio alkaliphilus]ERP31124.1 hypothetical protein CALK_2005 [Chitinivibrio alkaliphilus ACht1]